MAKKCDEADPDMVAAALLVLTIDVRAMSDTVERIKVAVHALAKLQGSIAAPA
jgi:hypothetical protein